MQRLRNLIRTHMPSALLLVVLALCMKALVPAGYMVEPTRGLSFDVTICAGFPGGQETIEMVLPMKDDHKPAQQNVAKDGGPCAFAGLAKVATGAGEPVLLALALAFLILLGLAPQTPAPRARRLHLRPYLRGPPIAA